jgi:hypothetical protein
MPTITFKTKEEIPESLQQHATEAADGTWKVGVVHESFRDKNTALLKERDTLAHALQTYKSVVGDTDPDALKNELEALRETAQMVKDGKLSKKEDIEAEVARRLQAKEAALTEQIKASATKAEEASRRAQDFEARWKTTIVDRAISEAVLAGDSGINPSALPDIMSRASRVFRAKEDGTLVAMQGDTIIYGEDGETSMKPKEWLRQVLKEAPHFAKPSAGGGANGGNEKGVAGSGLSESEWAKLPATERLTRARNAARS